MQQKRDLEERTSGLSAQELVEFWFRYITLDEELFAYARSETEKMVDSGRRLVLADLSAGKRYLLKCLKNMDLLELRALMPHDAASLWARGAAGACAYRYAKQEERVRR